MTRALSNAATPAPARRRFAGARVPGTAILLLAIILAGAPRAQVDPDFVDDTRTYLVRLEKLGFAGSIMVTVGGEVILAGGYGDAKRGPSVPWTPKTVSTIGSITKQFTAAAIMRLQEEGKLGVDDTLGQHFNDVPPDKAGITLHHLLSHSSGISDPPGTDDFDENTRDEYVRMILDAPLDAEPGTHYEYANANFSLLGAIIEQTTGLSYEEAMRELIFEPAGLSLTGYILPDYSGETVAEGYVGDERWGTILERPMAKDGPYWALRANGGIHSTAEEMVRWGQALLGDEVLSRESRDAMWSKHIDESNSGEGESFYGYGWVVLEPAPGVEVITHNGGNGILFADMTMIPSANVVAFVQTNVISTFRTTNDLLGQMLRRMRGESYPDVPVVVDVDAASLQKWSGTYKLGGDDQIEIAADGKTLLVTPHGWTAFAAVHSVPGQDTAPLIKLSGEIDRIVGATAAGDFQPIHDAYRGQVTLERLKEVYKSREAQRVAEYGALQGYDVLGTGTGEEYHFTLVRYRYEREPILRTYVWSRGDETNLLGVTTRHMDPACRFFPVEGGGFQSWEPSTGASVAARLIENAGDASFILKRGSGDVAAQR
jgi:CubicO group peptidase (beta-lactamase class C family)